MSILTGCFDIQKIIELATNFRTAIECAKSDGCFSSDQWFRNFPQGCCGITSELLARFLIENGVTQEITYMYGECYDDSLDRPAHAWLQIDGILIVDITGDQFKYYPEPIKSDNAIYIGPNNVFFRSFEIISTERCHNYYPLDDTYIRNHLSRKELYQIILKYLV